MRPMTMRFGLADIPDQAGRLAVVTGGNGGLGFETSAALAARGARVLLAARDQAKAARAVEAITGRTPHARIGVVPLDLGSLRSVRDAAATILAHHDRLDILVNNAGVMGMPEGRTADGFETQFGVDHLGHWALTALLMPALVAAPASRVVTVTSFARFGARPLDPGNPHLRGSYDPWRAYAQAKLANYHFGLGLQAAFEQAGVTASSLVADPGLAHTDLQPTTVRMGGAGRSAPVWAWLAARYGAPAQVAAVSTLRAATDPDARGGDLYGPLFLSRGPAVRLPILRRGNAEAIRVLWQVSERETGIPLVP